MWRKKMKSSDGNQLESIRAQHETGSCTDCNELDKRPRLQKDKTPETNIAATIAASTLTVKLETNSAGDF